ncbi:hypothetical protein EBB07_04370 [Paenibacillaceae bacterium]|nr:hypothetical protein EBB07_04370 [Paenibacillaceae bacterium]
MLNKHRMVPLISAAIFLLLLGAWLLLNPVTLEKGERPQPIVNKQQPESPDPSPVESDAIIRFSTLERGSQLRNYEAHETLYFSDPDVSLRIEFQFPPHGAAPDFAAWYPETAVFYEEEGVRKPVKFVRNDNSGSGSNLIEIILESAPEAELRIELSGSGDRKPIEADLLYSPPFEIQISSEDELFRMREQVVAMNGLQSIPWYVKLGASAEATLRFTGPVNRESANQRFSAIFQQQRWQAEWHDDQHVTLRFIPDAETSITLQFAGIENQQGYKLAALEREMIVIYPRQEISYGRIDRKGMKSELFRSPVPYYQFLPNTDGTLALAQVSESDENGLSVYLLLDLSNGGAIIRQYAPGSIEEPAWLSDEDAFVYSANVAQGLTEIHLRQAVSDIDQPLWKSTAVSDRIRWAKAFVTEGTLNDRLTVLEYYSTDNDYVFPYQADYYSVNLITGETDRQRKAVQQHYCEAMRCYQPFIPLATKLYLSANRISKEDGTEETYLIYNAETNRETLLPLAGSQLAAVLDDSRLLMIRQSDNPASGQVDERAFESVTEGFEESKQRYYVYNWREQTITNLPIGAEHLIRFPSPASQAWQSGEERYLLYGTGIWMEFDLRSLTFRELDYEALAQSGEFIYYRTGPI